MPPLNRAEVPAVSNSTEIPVTLRLGHWQLVLALIAKGPWETVDPLMRVILPQLAQAGALQQGEGGPGAGAGGPGDGDGLDRAQ
jgi:hypothetical protein